MMRQCKSIRRCCRCILQLGATLFLVVAVTNSFAAGFDAQGSMVPRDLAQGSSRVADANIGSEASRPTSTSDYRVDTGDRVSITVYQEPDLSVTGVRVKANGTIAYPLIGDLHVSGLTSQQVQDLVKRRLLDGYLKKPHVTVSIDSYRLYFIKGEVKRPGGYSFVDGLTVAKAVALAGGYTERASQSSVSLVRESNPDNPLESVAANTPIRPGDIITIGESFF
jgi:polysaccharide export outer membrane protein